MVKVKYAGPIGTHYVLSPTRQVANYGLHTRGDEFEIHVADQRAAPHVFVVVEEKAEESPKMTEDDRRTTEDEPKVTGESPEMTETVQPEVPEVEALVDPPPAVETPNSGRQAPTKTVKKPAKKRRA